MFLNNSAGACYTHLGNGVPRGDCWYGRDIITVDGYRVAEGPFVPTSVLKSFYYTVQWAAAFNVGWNRSMYVVSEVQKTVSNFFGCWYTRRT